MARSWLIKVVILGALVTLALIVTRPALSPTRARGEALPTETPLPATAAPRPATAVPAPVATVAPVPTPSPTPRTQPMAPVKLGETEYGELLSDGLFLYSSSALKFDVQAFLDSQPGPLKNFHETVEGADWSAARSISFNAINFGVSPQFLLIALEAEGGVISQPDAAIPSLYRLAGMPGFYTYVRWLAHNSLMAYDAARTNESRYQADFEDKTSLQVPRGLNAGTTAVEVTLAKVIPPGIWANWVQGQQPVFIQRYLSWFGNPYALPDGLPTSTSLPPGFVLPFPAGETWFYSGGPHSYDGVGARPWSSLDFMPPGKLWCPGSQTPTDRWVVAAASGTVIEATEALVVIDHGNGWRTYYSHVATQDRIAKGARVERGEHIGHPSCEVEPGGSTNGVHVHFALWRAGLGFVDASGSSLSGWLVEETSHYNGTLTHYDTTSTAEAAGVVGWNDVLNVPGSESLPVYVPMLFPDRPR